MGQFGELVGILVGVAVLLMVALAFRRFVLRRRSGTFDCSLRLRTKRHGQGWVYGIARYAGDGLEWYRVFSLSPLPKRIVARRDLVVRSRRRPRGAEALAVLAGAIVVECGVADRTLELAMSPEALTGFLSWLEAAPPGHHLVA